LGSHTSGPQPLAEAFADIRRDRSFGDSPRKTRFPAAGPALPDGIGYPQSFNERFHILS
jgi:hypothetical protein